MASYFSYLETLPARVFEDILLFLDVLDLGRLTRVSRSLRDFICKDDILWKFHCKSIWLLEELSPNAGTWYQQWLSMANSDWWPYRDCYAKVKGSWETLESVLASRCPSAYEEVVSSKGATVKEIEQIEKKFGTVLPKDYKCSLRIHGQQTIRLGSVEFSDESSRKRCNFQFTLLGFSQLFLFELDLRSDRITFGGSLSPQMVAKSYRKREFLLVLARNSSYERGLQPFSENLVLSTNSSSCVVSEGLVRTLYYRKRGWVTKVLLSEHALSFSDWLKQEAVNIKSYHVTAVDRHLTRFTVQPTSTTTTDHFTVTVGVSFDPSFGHWKRQFNTRPFYVGFGYCISITMSADAPEEDSCKLIHAHWNYTETSNCPYVVDSNNIEGKSPVFHPGDNVEYSRYMIFPGLANHGQVTVSGYFIMKYLNRSNHFRINIPPFLLGVDDFYLFCEIPEL